MTLDPRITGRFEYGQDQQVEGMLHARILRSPHAHAKVLSINTSEVPQQVVTLTRDDVADLEPLYGPMVKDQPIVARERVLHVGDAVAAVAAGTPREAEEAIALVEVEYEEMPGVFDPVDATGDAAPLLHDGIEIPAELRPDGRNICHRFRLQSGLGQQGFELADVVVEDTFAVAAAAHVAMEPHATLAYWEEGRLHVITGTQTPFNVRRDLAALFRLSEEMIRIVVAPMGGSFGAKTFMRLEPITAALARKARRPVRAVLTRGEEFLTVNRHPARFHIRLGATRDGTFVAKSVDAWWDTGAYADCGPSVCTKGGYAAIGPYRIPNVTVDSRCVYTNLPPAGAFRGYAATQGVWASERVTDLMAGRLEIDPLELRLRNLLRDGDRFATGEVMRDVRFAACLRAAAEAVDWSEGRKNKGLAVMLKGMQTPSRTGVALEIDAGGHILLRSATTDMGQRPDIAQRNLAAEALGLSPDLIAVGPNDTDLVPFDTRTTSSRSTFMMSNAIREAANDLRRKIAERFEVAPEDLVLSDEGAGVAGSPDLSRPLADLAGLRGDGTFVTPGGLDPDTGQGIASSHWHQAAASAEVRVDPETGVTSITRLHTAVYAGNVVDRPGAELQNEGSTIFGIGTALFEGIVFEGGQVTNGNLSDYEIPSILDVPDFTYDLLEGGEHSHGLGEMAVPVVPAAIGNAVAAAGHPVRNLPMSAEAVLGSSTSQGLRRPSSPQGGWEGD
ncbi:MAG TPA: xanthine dehydrogenase family protein molybdopterin-binding subunit [Candidatus Dormibacteraeota bacterium]|nr:xanthine dehydrogenase family protein molybdopterin-binding subunit [Candidatus Dormibacteraeota bacterium]